MGIACTFGFHNWGGCKCAKCGKTRDEGHNWSRDCERCAVCGAPRQSAHSWDGCKCSTCGKARDAGHNWNQDCERCANCGATRENPAKLNGCTCAICTIAAFMQAASKGQLDVVRQLIEKGVDANVKDENGKTALMYAIKGGHADTVRFFLKGGDMKKADNYGINPPGYEVKSWYADIV